MNNLCDWDHLLGRDILSIKIQVTRIECSHNGQFIACAGWDCRIRIFNTKSEKEVQCLQGMNSTNCSMKYSKDDKFIISGEYNGAIRIWNTETGQQIKDPFLKHNCQSYNTCFSPDGSSIAFSSGERNYNNQKYYHMVRIHNIESSQELTLKGHQDIIYSFVFSPNGKCLVSSSRDFTIRIWNTNTGKQLRVIKFEKHSAVYNVSLSSNGKTLGSNHFNYIVRIWDMRKSKLINRLKYLKTPAPDLLFSRNGKFLLLGYHQKQIQLYNIVNRKSVIIEGDYEDMFFVQFSPDGQYIVSANLTLIRVHRIPI